MKRMISALLCLVLALMPACFAESETDDSIYSYSYRDDETGLYFFASHEAIGLRDEEGNVLLEPCLSEYYYYYFSDGIANVCTPDELWGYIDVNGEWIIEPQFESARNFSNGYACILEGDKFGFIDLQGNWIIEPTLDYAWDFIDGGYTIANVDGLYGYLLMDGSWLIEPQYDYAEAFWDGMAVVRVHERDGMIDMEGNWIIEPIYEYLDSFHDGIALASIDNRFGFINQENEWVIEPIYEYADCFSEGLAAVCINGKYGYINLDGQLVIPAIYDYVLPFSHGLAEAGLESNYCVIDAQGRVVINDPDAWQYIIESEDSIIVTYADMSYRYYTRTESGFEAIDAVKSNFDLADYYPNSGEKLVVTDHEPTLQLSAETAPLPRVDGATALFPMYSAMVQACYPADTAYDEEPDAQTLITCSKTDGSYERLIAGECDVIFAGLPSDAQRAAVEAAGMEFELTPIALEAFVFIVNRENPLEDITTQQIRDIYSGRTTEWSQLGVNTLGEIIAYQRSENSGSQNAMQRLMAEDTLMPAPEAVVAWEMGDIIERVEYQNFDNAIGYSFRFYVTGLMQADVKLLNIDGVAPTIENIANGSYPLTSQIFMVTRKGYENANLDAFIAWAQSEQGRELIEKSGYVPV